MHQSLHELRDRAESLNASLIEDLLPFVSREKPVFRRLPDSDELGNVTTTSSCLMSMATSNNFVDFFKEAGNQFAGKDSKENVTDIFEYAVNETWESSGLKNDNAFSSLIVLRTAGLLLKNNSTDLTRPLLEMGHPIESIKEMSKRLNKQPTSEELLARPKELLKEMVLRFAKDAPNSFKVEDYPSTPAIAYWFIDAVENLNMDLSLDDWNRIARWVAETFARHLSLVTSQHDAMKDPVQMAMAACLATRMLRIITSQDFKTNDVPTKTTKVLKDARNEMIRVLPTKIEVEYAVLKAFEFQENSGIWPKYFPLFNYKDGGAGSNFFFSFELLEVIIHEFEDTSLLENEIVTKGIERALSWCENNRFTYYLEGKTYRGWNSGGQITTLSRGVPESWATAVVHMFLYKLRIALSLLIEKHVLSKYGASKPHFLKKDASAWDRFSNSPVQLPDDQQTSVKDLIQQQILDHIEGQPIANHKKKISGRRSALLFGPPGTSKTTLVRAIAKKIGWPLVELNPSDFLSKGLENIYSQSTQIFKDLKELSSAVVFFDEMDALAQRRDQSLDVIRQFLTTSMLPKLSTLHDDAQVLFFMATNHQRNFDDAIKRPGRFDLLICMGPPTWKNKLEGLETYLSKNKDKDNQEKIDSTKSTLSKWAPEGDRVAQTLDLFTYGEFQSFIEQISKGDSLNDVVTAMGETKFREKVTDWGNQYITLRTQTPLEREAEDSPLVEYEEDKLASRVQ